MKTIKLTYARAHELFRYNPFTGNLIRKSKKGPSRKGSIAGCIYTVSGKNYKTVSVSADYVRYLAHRIIWLMMTGRWPSEEIDHINGNGIDNRWVNLREATHSQGAKNIGKKHLSKTGVMGVRLTKWGYQVRITVDRRELYFGTFKTLSEASEVRRNAAIKYHGEFARLD